MSPPRHLPPNGPLPDLVSRHFEEASFLWTLRRRAVDAPHYTFADLERLDERIEAHLDGLRIAGASAEAVIDEGLDVAGCCRAPWLRERGPSSSRLRDGVATTAHRRRETGAPRPLM